MAVRRLGSLLQHRKRLAGGRKKIRSPLESHEGTRLVMKPVGTVERHPDRLPLVLEAEVPAPAGFGKARERITLARIRA